MNILKQAWTNLTGIAYGAGVDVAAAFNRGYGHTVNKQGYRGNNNPEGNPHGTGHHAAGGYVNAGETTWVGERGPEKVTFGRGAHISSAADSGGGHGHTIVMDGRVVGALIDQRFGRNQSLAPGSAYTRGS